MDSNLQVTTLFLIRFRSGFWLGLSRTFISLFLNHSIGALDVCFGSSCWKMNFRPNFRFLAEGAAGFPQGSFCILLHPFSLLSWQVPQYLLKRNIPITWCCHHHALQWGWCSLGDVLSWVCAKCNVLHLGQKVPSWFRQTRKGFATWLQNLWSVFFANLK